MVCLEENNILTIEYRVIKSKMASLAKGEKKNRIKRWLLGWRGWAEAGVITDSSVIGAERSELVKLLM